MTSPLTEKVHNCETLKYQKFLKKMLLKAFREKPGVKIMVALDFSTVSWILEDNDEKFQNSEENFFAT